MTKFVFVKKRPETLQKGEYLIDRPYFLEEIAMHRNKAPKNGLTGHFHLRVILDSIVQRYDPQGTNMYSIRTVNFEGRPFSSDEDLDNILLELLNAECPDLLLKYLEARIKARPSGTEMVVYVESGIKDAFHAFCISGLDPYFGEYPIKPKSELDADSKTSRSSSSKAKTSSSSSSKTQSDSSTTT